MRTHFFGSPADPIFLFPLKRRVTYPLSLAISVHELLEVRRLFDLEENFRSILKVRKLT